jgi:hypothetical protein
MALNFTFFTKFLNKTSLPNLAQKSQTKYTIGQRVFSKQ